MFCVRRLFRLNLCFILKVITLNTKLAKQQQQQQTLKRRRCIALKLKIVDKLISDILFLFPFSNYQTIRLNGQETHKDKIRSFR